MSGWLPAFQTVRVVFEGLIWPFSPTTNRIETFVYQQLHEAFIRELRTMYERTYGTMEPGYPGVISVVAQLALENIATSDAAYHDVNHTIMVTLVGQDILRGRHISVGGVTPRDWLRFIISLLCHDIGYVRGICRGDGDGSYVTNLAGDTVTLPEEWRFLSSRQCPLWVRSGHGAIKLRCPLYPQYRTSLSAI
jgi:hypothetical protein